MFEGNVEGDVWMPRIIGLSAESRHWLPGSQTKMHLCLCVQMKPCDKHLLTGAKYTNVK